MKVERALILEPLNPIYGVGAVLFTVLVIPIYKKGSLAVFVSSMFIGGIFEYVCSFMQEMIFGTISWQYGKDVLGILDRTSFIYCIFGEFLEYYGLNSYILYLLIYLIK